MSSETSWRRDRLRTLREEHGWSQRELGRRCGIIETMIAKYERDQADPSLPTLRKLAEILEVSADYLLGITDDPRPHVTDDPSMTDDERAVLETFRHEGWRGVIRLGAERMP